MKRTVLSLSIMASLISDLSAEDIIGLSVDPSGNVGIGVQRPQSKLHVNGDINTSGKITASAAIKSDTTLTAENNITTITGDISTQTGDIISGGNILSKGDINTTGNILLAGKLTSRSVVTGDILSDGNFTSSGEIISKSIKATENIIAMGKIDSNKTVTAHSDIMSKTGNIYTNQGDIQSGKNITATGDINASGSISTGSGNIISGGSITSAGDINATGDILSGGSITSTTEIKSNTNIHAKHNITFGGVLKGTPNNIQNYSGVAVLQGYNTQNPLKHPKMAIIYDANTYGDNPKAITIHNLTSNVFKTFIINHPTDKQKYLVHASLEGPEGAVYYRGSAKLKEGKADIKLPPYFESLTRREGRTIMLTNIDGFDQLAVKKRENVKIKEGLFTVYSDNKKSTQAFDWEVKAVRADGKKLVVEPHKSDLNVSGFGPYTFTQ